MSGAEDMTNWPDVESLDINKYQDVMPRLWQHFLAELSPLEIRRLFLESS